MDKPKMQAWLRDDLVLINKNSFEHLLNCLANQKFINDVNADGISDGIESVKKTQAEIQSLIDDYWVQGMDLLNPKK